MKNFLDPFNLVLWFIVISFWSAAILLAKVKTRSISLRILVIPAFFILIGMTINLYYQHIGTYMIALIHVIMLPALKKVADKKRS